MKRNKMTRILSLIILSALLLTQQINGEPVKDPTTSTLRQKIEYVKTRHGVKFVYDSSLLLDIPYRGKKLDGLPLTKPCGIIPQHRAALGEKRRLRYHNAC